MADSRAGEGGGAQERLIRAFGIVNVLRLSHFILEEILKWAP